MAQGGGEVDTMSELNPDGTFAYAKVLESEITRLRAEVDALGKLYQKAIETNQKQAEHSIEQRKEIGIIKSANEFLVDEEIAVPRGLVVLLFSTIFIIYFLSGCHEKPKPMTRIELTACCETHSCENCK